MKTYRRLNDGSRYYGLTAQGWIAALGAAAVLYLGARFSPVGFKPTVTILVMILAFFGAALAALQGQALGPARYLTAIVSWRFGARYYDLSETNAETGGIVVDAVPSQLADLDDDLVWDDDLDDLDDLETIAEPARGNL